MPCLTGKPRVAAVSTLGDEDVASEDERDMGPYEIVPGRRPHPGSRHGEWRIEEPRDPHLETLAREALVGKTPGREALARMSPPRIHRRLELSSRWSLHLMKQQPGPSAMRLPLQAKLGPTRVAWTPSARRTKVSMRRKAEETAD